MRHREMTRCLHGSLPIAILTTEETAEEIRITVSRPAVALPVVIRLLPASNAPLLGRRHFGFRYGSRLDLWLSSENGVRRHIGRGCRRSGEDLCRVRTPRLR